MTTKEINTNKITARIADISLRNAAILAGVGFLVSFIGATFATLFGGDAATTANNYMAGVFGFLIAILGDMLRAWAL